MTRLLCSRGRRATAAHGRQRPTRVQVQIWVACNGPLEQSSAFASFTVSGAPEPFFHDVREMLDLPEARGFELSLCLTLTMTRRVDSGGLRS